MLLILESAGVLANDSQKVYTHRGSYNGVLADFIIKSNALTDEYGRFLADNDL